MLSRLFDDNLKVNGLKCEFCLRKVEVLGDIICDGVLYPKVDRLQGLKDLKRPNSKTEVR